MISVGEHLFDRVPEKQAGENTNAHGFILATAGHKPGVWHTSQQQRGVFVCLARTRQTPWNRLLCWKLTQAHHAEGRNHKRRRRDHHYLARSKRITHPHYRRQGIFERPGVRDSTAHRWVRFCWPSYLLRSRPHAHFVGHEIEQMLWSSEDTKSAPQGCLLAASSRQILTIFLSSHPTSIDWLLWPPFPLVGLA